MEGPKDIRRDRFVVNENIDFWSGKCQELSIFHISAPFWRYVPSNAPDSNPINLFVCEVSTTSKLEFGVLIDWRALECLKVSQKRFVSLYLSLSLCSDQEFPKSTLRGSEQQERKWAFGPINFTKCTDSRKW